jgi:hypothetical protein
MSKTAALFAMVVMAVVGCSASAPRAPALRPLADLRSDGHASADGEVVGRWALMEVLAPGGNAKEAALARARLETLPHGGMWASLARAVIDEAHGDPRSASEAFVATAAASAASGEPQAPLVGWFAVRHLMSLRGSVADLFARNRIAFDSLLARPGHLGWRAVADLEDWRAVEVHETAERTGDAYDDDVVKRMGCARDVRLAGPFGHGGAPGALASRVAARRDARKRPARALRDAEAMSRRR